jgi:hypothetical protein
MPRVLVLLLILPLTLQAQQTGAGSPERKEFASELHNLHSELVKATEDYKQSLVQLLTLYEAEVTRARERVKKSDELYAAHLIGRREVEEDRAAVPVAVAKVERAKKQIADADEQIKVIFKELIESDELEKKLAKQPPKRERTPKGRVYLVRFIIIGEVVIYDYSGAVRGRLIKRGNQVRYDSRKKWI